MQQWYGCPNCGTMVAFGQRFCENCGAHLGYPTQYQSPPAQYQQPPTLPYYQQQIYKQAAKPQKSRVGLWAIIVILIALLVL